MYKVKNIDGNPRKFRDRKSGRDVIIQPSESFLTENPPSPSSVWKIDEIKKEEKSKKSKEVG